MNTLLSSSEVLALVNTEYSVLGQANQCKFLDRGFNDTYLVGIGTQWYVFRVYFNHKYYIESADAFRFELDLLNHLDGCGIPVSVSIPRDNKESLGFTATSQGDRAFALFTYAAGDVISGKSATPERCFQVGKTTAQMHLAANSFKSEYNRYHLNRKYLVDEPLKRIAEQSDEATRVIAEDNVEGLEEMVASLQPIEELMDAVSAMDLSGDEYGIIHSDLHPGNFHADGDQITLFDFDHCAYGWRAYELAVTEFMQEEKKQELLKGYESVRPLSQGERDCIPVFAKLRRLWDIGDSIACKPVRAESSD